MIKTKHFIIFAYILSNMASIAVIAISLTAYLKEKTQLTKEIFVYSLFLYLGLLSVFIADYNKYFVGIGYESRILYTIQDVCLICYIFALFRASELLCYGKFLIKRKIVAVFFVIYFIIQWQFIYNVSVKYLERGNNINMLAAGMDIVYYFIIPAICFARIIFSLEKIGNKIYRQYFIKKILLSFLFLMLLFSGRSTSIYSTNGKILSYSAVYLYSVYCIIVMYFIIKYIIIKSSVTNKNTDRTAEESAGKYDREEDRESKKDKIIHSINNEIISELSEREEEILYLLLQNNTYRKIAEELGVAYKTVDNHIQNIYRKVGVSGRKELISRVITNI